MIDLETIWINDNKEVVYVIREGFYNKEKGIASLGKDQIL